MYLQCTLDNVQRVREGAGENQGEGLRTSGGWMESNTMKKWDLCNGFPPAVGCCNDCVTQVSMNGVFKVTFY